MGLIEKLFFVGVVVYLLVAVPVHFLNYEKMVVCQDICDVEEYDIVMFASGLFVLEKCGCYSSDTRKDKIIEVGER